MGSRALMDPPDSLDPLDQRLPALRAGAWSGRREEEHVITQSRWKDHAACQGYDLEIFFSENKVDQEFAVSLCSRCPVKKHCFDNADADDFKWSVRAGYKPGEYKGGPSRPPLFPKGVKYDRPETKEKKEQTRLASTEARTKKDWSHKLGTLCMREHEYTEQNMDAYGRCRKCMSVRQRRLRAAAKLEKC